MVIEQAATSNRRHELVLEQGAAPRALMEIETAFERLAWGRLEDRPGHVHHGRVQPPGVPPGEVTVRALDVDEDAGTAHFDFQAREVGGPGMVTGTFQAQAGESKLALEADFRWIGVHAPVETVERIADSLLGDLGAAIEARAADASSGVASAMAADASNGVARATAERGGTSLPRGAAPAVGAAAALAVAAIARRWSRRRHSTSISITYRW